MREIKFRAWDGEMMSYFSIGIDNSGYITLPPLPPDGRAFLELMQDTGLKDTHGKEIYEGDVLRYCVRYPRDFQERNPLKKHGRIAGPVIREKGWLWLDYRPEDDDGTLLSEAEAKGWEVIDALCEGKTIEEYLTAIEN